MQRLHYLFILMVGLLLQGCGSDCTLGTACDGGSTPGDSSVASIALSASDTDLPSDGSQTSLITAIVKDSDNAIIENASVTFSVDSGGIAVTQGVTDVSGAALATVDTVGEPSNRQIQVSASSGGVTETLFITVQGTDIAINGPDNLASGLSGTYTITLADASGDGIDNETLAVSAGGTLSATSLTTDGNGQAQVNLTANAGGTEDTLVASGLGALANKVINISLDSFAFVAPAASVNTIDLGDTETFTVSWSQGGMPVVGGTVNFTATRGIFGGSMTSVEAATTNASGLASVTLSAIDAGPSTITAAAVGGPTSTRLVELVATVPASIEVQANPFSIGENETATITATVRDANDNLVKDEAIAFTLLDSTGGTLSTGTAVTNSNGVASTVYQASSVTSSQNDVRITATVIEDTSISNFVDLTVAQREVSINFGFDNFLIDNPPDYNKQLSVRVLDANNVALEGVDVQLSVSSDEFSQGFWAITDDGMGNTSDDYIQFITSICQNEDANSNNLLDPLEDTNNNGQLDPGSVVGISPGTVTTGADGRGLALLSYSKVYGAWISVTIEARAAVQGTEFIDSKTILLGVLADDVDADGAAPGQPVLINPAEDTSFIVGNGRSPATLAGAANVSPFGYSDALGCDDWSFAP